MIETAIYIHIPFCDHKCIYCDFYSITSYKNISAYLSSLKKEIEFYSEKFSDNRKIISIFFGGGTPSFMNPEYISEIIESVRNNFLLSQDAEITLETNPGTVDKQKLLDFKNAGINRISIGIQSFDDMDLKFLTRIHNSNSAIQTVTDAAECGFSKISIDLIFNLPGQTRKKWKENLEKAVELPINHISAYSLILEKGTILNKMVLDGKIKMSDEDHDADLYQFTIDFLEQNKFRQYEVSNFAKEGEECVHNNAYWRYKDYLGFGTSAHSFAGGKRWWNYSALNLYNTAVESKSNGAAGEEILSEKEMQDEYVMLALRSKGIDLLEMKNLFGGNWYDLNKEILDQLINGNIISINNGLLSLTPKGYPICDEILAKLRTE